MSLTKNNKEYISGEVQSGVNIQFKSWSNSAAFRRFKDEDWSNQPANIVATVDMFGGTPSLVIESVEVAQGYTPDQFLPVKYNAQAYFKALKNLADTAISEKGRFIVNKVLFDNEETKKRFCEEFAARTHHDNCKCGLLAHTYKVVSILDYLLKMHPSLQKDTNFTDILYTGAILHDIGKIKEYNFGVIQPEACVGHLYFGLEPIMAMKDEIVAVYGEKGYYDLVSIIMQHHGEYDMNCRTVSAFLVFQADCLDAKVTDMVQAMETPCEGRIKLDGKWLSV